MASMQIFQEKLIIQFAALLEVFFSIICFYFHLLSLIELSVDTLLVLFWVI